MVSTHFVASESSARVNEDNIYIMYMYILIYNVNFVW